MCVAPFSEVAVSIWTSPILKEALFVHLLGGEQQLAGEEFLLTEVAVEYADKDEEGPDHDDDHHFLVGVQLVADVAGLRFNGAIFGALKDPFSQVPNTLEFRDISNVHILTFVLTYFPPVHAIH